MKQEMLGEIFIMIAVALTVGWVIFSCFLKPAMVKKTIKNYLLLAVPVVTVIVTVIALQFIPDPKDFGKYSIPIALFMCGFVCAILYGIFRNDIQSLGPKKKSEPKITQKPNPAGEVLNSINISDYVSDMPEVIPGYTRIENDMFICDHRATESDRYYTTFDHEVLIVKDKDPANKESVATRLKLFMEPLIQQAQDHKVESLKAFQSYYGENPDVLFESSIFSRAFVHPNIWPSIDALDVKKTCRFNNYSPTDLFQEYVHPHDTMRSIGLLGPGGVYEISIVRSEIKFAHNVTFMFHGDHTIDVLPGVYNNYHIGYKRELVKKVNVTRLTKEIVEMMMTKDMTNLPYSGGVFDQEGYKAVFLKMDNEIHLFCDVNEYDHHRDVSRLRDTKPSELLNALIQLRTRRDTGLVPQDYGFSYLEDGVSIYWYV